MSRCSELKDGGELYENWEQCSCGLQGGARWQVGQIDKEAVANNRQNLLGSALSMSGVSLQLDIGMKFVLICLLQISM